LKSTRVQALRSFVIVCVAHVRLHLGRARLIAERFQYAIA
jgi:hypothetical protein